MKKSIYVFAFAAILFTACNSSSKKEGHQAGELEEMSQNEEGHDHDDMDSEKHHDMDVTSITVQESKSVTAILDTYLELKDALANDNSSEAASSGKKLFEAFKSFAPSSVAEDQKTELKEIIEDAGMHAEHISENDGNIVHQREHFEILSTDVKDLVAIAGADRTLYQQFCPMYNDKKGGMWLSASDEIKNPFFGGKMPKCGEVQEKISIK